VKKTKFLTHSPAMKKEAAMPSRLAHPSTIRAFQRRLMEWYKQHGRDLPWRRTRDPYAILVSEVMLQQTQVSRALLYYERFLDRYPTVADLASADEGEVRETWEGLGYYHRARNLQRASQEIVEKHKGRFPQTHEKLTALPGIGAYTAGAVRSFAFHHDAAILDTNAVRVLTRFFALPPEQQTNRFLWSVAHQVTPSGRAHIFNQAIMDLGATICVARAPRCRVCPLQLVCRSVRGNTGKRHPDS
jgi:A/G-specific adenine glycosylase